jgi:hypothetical protein
LSDIYQALARTALLIELDIFGSGADHHAIIDGLRDTTARIITDRASADPAPDQLRGCAVRNAQIGQP